MDYLTYSLQLKINRNIKSHLIALTFRENFSNSLTKVSSNKPSNFFFLKSKEIPKFMNCRIASMDNKEVYLFP